MSGLKQAKKQRNKHRRIVAVHGFLVQDGRLLLLERNNTGFRDGEYSVPAGHVEPGEAVANALVREAREETGVSLSPTLVQPVHVMDRFEEEERIDVFFAAEQWEGRVTNREPEKCAGMIWADYSRLPDNTIPYIRQAVKKWRQNVFFSRFGR